MVLTKTYALSTPSTSGTTSLLASRAQTRVLWSRRRTMVSLHSVRTLLSAAQSGGLDSATVPPAVTCQSMAPALGWIPYLSTPRSVLSTECPTCTQALALSSTNTILARNTPDAALLSLRTLLASTIKLVALIPTEPSATVRLVATHMASSSAAFGAMPVNNFASATWSLSTSTKAVKLYAAPMDTPPRARIEGSASRQPTLATSGVPAAMLQA